MKTLPAACRNSPLMTIEWRDADSLTANHWNPNYVMTPELKLLERSLLVTGWIQPVLITAAGVIIDGFHRVQLSRDSAALRGQYEGMVACTVLDCSAAEAKMLTVRINRAKGVHGALRLSELVRELIDVDHCDPAEVALEIGATKDEIALLYQESVFTKKNIQDYRYSTPWVPRESLTQL